MEKYINTPSQSKTLNFFYPKWINTKSRKTLKLSERIGLPHSNKQTKKSIGEVMDVFINLIEIIISHHIF